MLQFCDTVFDSNLTHLTGNILDLVLTTEVDLINKLRVHPVIETPLATDHFLISFDLQVVCDQLFRMKSTDYCKADWEGFF